MIRLKEHINPINQRDLERFDSKLKKLDPREYSVYVTDKKHQRSLSQNAYYHAVVVPLVSAHTGYSKEETHQQLAFRFNPEMIEVDGEMYKVPGSTSKLNTSQFNEYLESIKQWASEEMGIYIPDPNEIPEEVLINQI